MGKYYDYSATLILVGSCTEYSHRNPVGRIQLGGAHYFPALSSGR